MKQADCVTFSDHELVSRCSCGMIECGMVVFSIDESEKTDPFAGHFCYLQFTAYPSYAILESTRFRLPT